MKINYSFWILIIYSLFVGYFKLLLLLLLCLLIHELGHLIIIFIYRLKINCFQLSIFGGEINMDLSNISKFKLFILYSNGIIFNFLFLIISYLLGNEELIKCNILLIAINSISLFPLDGFHIFSIFFSQNFMINISFIFLFTIFISSIYIRSLGIFIIFFFLLTKFILFLKTKNEKKLFNIIKSMI